MAWPCGVISQQYALLSQHVATRMLAAGWKLGGWVGGGGWVDCWQQEACVARARASHVMSCSTGAKPCKRAAGADAAPRSLSRVPARAHAAPGRGYAAMRVQSCTMRHHARHSAALASCALKHMQTQPDCALNPIRLHSRSKRGWKLHPGRAASAPPHLRRSHRTSVRLVPRT